MGNANNRFLLITLERSKAMSYKIERPQLEIFSSNLRRLMAEKNIGQNELSRRLKCSAPTVNSWCQGYTMPRRELFEKLCQVLNVTRNEQYDEFAEMVKAERTINKDLTVEGLLDWYITRFKSNGGKETTARAYKVAKSAIVNCFKQEKAKDITLYHIDKFLASETKIHAPKTIKNELSLLSSGTLLSILPSVFTPIFLPRLRPHQRPFLTL